MDLSDEILGIPRKFMDTSEENLGIPRKFMDLSNQMRGIVRVHGLVRGNPRKFWEIRGPARPDAGEEILGIPKKFMDLSEEILGVPRKLMDLSDQTHGIDARKVGTEGISSFHSRVSLIRRCSVQERERERRATEKKGGG